MLIPVSVGEEETTRQLDKLREVAVDRGWKVVEIVGETGIGGLTEPHPGLERILELARTGRIDKVLADGICSIDRRSALVLRFLEDLHAVGVSFHWHARDIDTLLPGGDVSPAGSTILALLSEMAHAGRERRRERILDGLEEARKSGKVLGRPPGTTDTPEEILKRYEQVVRHLGDGRSLRETARLAGVAQGTVQRVKKAMQAMDLQTGEANPEEEPRRDEAPIQAYEELPVELL